MAGHLLGAMPMSWPMPTSHVSINRYQEIYLTFCVLCMHHENIIKWELFPRCRPFVRGIHRSPVNSPDRGQWRGALMFSLMYAWFNVWVNNGDAGGLRRLRDHNDVTVMIEIYFACFQNLELVPLNDTIEWRCSAVHFLYDITYGTMITVANLRSDFKLTAGYLCPAVTGQLWDACCEDIGRNLPV